MSDIKKVISNAKRYLGDNINIKQSTRKGKKFMVQRPDGSWSHFGSSLYNDYTLTGDNSKRKNYLLRSGNIRGDWKKDKYSSNNLSREILWR